MPLNNYPTFEIVSVADQERLVKEPSAVLCLWFEWSVPAQLARGAIGYWHERWHSYCKARPVVPLYFMDGDKVPGLMGWIGEALREIGGNGSLYLFRSGEVVARIPSVIDAGLLHISTVCNEHFTPDAA